jgi:hypothetical protein
MNNNFSFIKETFLSLVNFTYPHGFEDDLVEDMIKYKIFPNLEKDVYGNYFLKIGVSKTIFASHLDTACKDHTPVNYNVGKDKIVRTDGKTVLGADDKAGVTVMLFLIKNNIPGLYYFFIGEEVGCIGSSNASIGSSDFFKEYDRIISFDRRGTNSVITFQSSKRCCSDEFAEELAKQLNKSRSKNLFYKTDDTGVYTDSAEFVKLIPECTNISVGYYKEHTVEEHQDLLHLFKLSEACLDVDWENLPVKRDRDKTEYKSYNYSRYDYYDDWDEYDNEIDYFKENPYESLRPNWFNSSGGWDEVPNNRRSNKRGKRGGSKGSKVYYDSGDGLNLLESTKMIDTFKDKFFMKDITRHELDCLCEIYFDFEKQEDLDMYSYLVYNLSE